MTARFEFYGGNYPRWRVWDPKEKRERVCAEHQLLAIADGADPHKVFSGGEWHVHHIESWPSYNVRSNLELRDSQEHGSYHLHGVELD